MPFTVPCPTCASPLSVRDEYAGKKIRCPECKTVLPATAPSVPSPPPPKPTSPPIAAAKPVAVPAVPRPAPTAAPPRKPRVIVEIDEDEDDEAPPRRPSKKPKARGKGANRKPLLWVLGGVGGLVLLAAGCGGVYALVSWSSGGPFNPFTDTAAVTQENAERVKSGMTVAEVEAIFGKGRPAVVQDLQDAHEAVMDPEFTLQMVDAWTPLLDAGGVLTWTRGKSRLMVGFTKPPRQGGTVVGVLAVIVTGGSVESYQFVETRSGGWPVGPGVPVAPQPGQPPEVTADALLDEYAADPAAAEAKYKGKGVRLTAEVKAVGGGTLTLAAKAVGDAGYEVRAAFPVNELAAVARVRVTDRVTVTGTVAAFVRFGKGKAVFVNDCRLAD